MKPLRMWCAKFGNIVGDLVGAVVYGYQLGRVQYPTPKRILKKKA